MTQQDETTLAAQTEHPPQTDALGYCTICHMQWHSLERVELLIVRKRAVIVTAYPGCNHPMIYRSLHAP